MTVAVDTAVLGSGAVALAHALFQAGHGPVVLAGQQAAALPAVERVPAPLLTLLLELGIVPAELDVDRLTRRRVVAWEDPSPDERDGPACAHVDRGALVDALWRRVRACPDVHVGRAVRHRSEITSVRRLGFEGPGWRARRLVDATGRRALTATRRVQPSPVWVATCCTVPRGDRDPTMRLAAGAGGYAYRLGSARWLTVGWVGPGAPPLDGAGVGQRIAREGAAWLTDGIDLRGAQIVRRVASIAVAAGARDPGVIAIGDAALGRDALASQGAAVGLSDARLAAGPDPEVGRRHAEGLERHLDHLTGMLAACRHHRSQAWLVYRRWLEGQRRISRTATAPQPQIG